MAEFLGFQSLSKMSMRRPAYGGQASYGARDR